MPASSRQDVAIRMNIPLRAVPTPCVGVCALDDDGYCRGCRRTLAEIAGWSQMSDEQRLRLMDSVLPQRESSRR